MRKNKNDNLHTIVSIYKDGYKISKKISSFLEMDNTQDYLFYKERLTISHTTKGIPIHKAALLDHLKIVYTSLLEKHDKEQCNTQDDLGRYPLDYALMNGKKNAIQVLLAYDAPYKTKYLKYCKKKYFELNESIDSWLTSENNIDSIHKIVELEHSIYLSEKEDEENIKNNTNESSWIPSFFRKETYSPIPSSDEFSPIGYSTAHSKQD